MQFIDEAKIFIKSGDGGNGCVSFRREKYIDMGGPDGGNGGRGGSVILVPEPGLNTLIDFRYQQHFKAQKGSHGMGKCRSGKAGDDIIIKVPIGTQVFEEDGTTLLFDITDSEKKIVFLKGGDGGFGNDHFKTSTNRSPRRSTPGWEGEERWVWLKLKLISDAGLVGLPNAGKSTFLSKVSRAKPKIADYPFTTLKPMLGVVYVDEKEFVMADIPGLIEGASEGHGLGHRFLKHIERCGVILHLVDVTSEDVVKSYKTIRKELGKYSEDLKKKDEIIALNKCDAVSEEEAEEKRKKLEKSSKKKVVLISCASGAGLKEALRGIYAKVKEFRAAEEESD